MKNLEAPSEYEADDLARNAGPGNGYLISWEDRFLDAEVRRYGGTASTSWQRLYLARECAHVGSSLLEGAEVL